MAPAPCEAGTWRPFILDACCHTPHATYPGSGPETALRVSPRTAPIRFCSRWGLPCRFRYRSRGGLLPHPFTLTAETAAVCFLWHFPWGRPRRPLAGTVSPWSPDFPHPQPFDSRWCGRPAGWQGYKGVRDPKGKSTRSRFAFETGSSGEPLAPQWRRKPVEPYAQINQRCRSAPQPCGNRLKTSGSYAWRHGRHCI